MVNWNDNVTILYIRIMKVIFDLVKPGIYVIVVIWCVKREKELIIRFI